MKHLGRSHLKLLSAAGSKSPRVTFWWHCHLCGFRQVAPCLNIFSCLTPNAVVVRCVLYYSSIVSAKVQVRTMFTVFVCHLLCPLFLGIWLLVVPTEDVGFDSLSIYILALSLTPCRSISTTSVQHCSILMILIAMSSNDAKPYYQEYTREGDAEYSATDTLCWDVIDRQVRSGRSWVKWVSTRSSSTRTKGIPVIGG